MPKNKKKSNSNKLLKWLKPAGPAKNMLLFAIVFAAIGGSYMVYQSFAFTTSDHSWTYYSNVPGEITLRSGVAVKQTDSHGGLPNTTIWRLERGATVGAKINVYSAPLTKTIQECVYFRFTNNTFNDVFGFDGGKTSSGAFDGSFTYQRKCGPKHTVQFPGTFDEKIINYGLGDMYIKWIGIVW